MFSVTPVPVATVQRWQPAAMLAVDGSGHVNGLRARDNMSVDEVTTLVVVWPRWVRCSMSPMGTSQISHVILGRTVGEIRTFWQHVSDNSAISRAISGGSRCRFGCLLLVSFDYYCQRTRSLIN
jgi:hypothetical protein